MIDVDTLRCDRCGTCIGVCPVDAIVMEFDRLTVVRDRCILCGNCVAVCPVGALGEIE